MIVIVNEYAIVHSLVTMCLPLDLVLTSYWHDGYRVNGIVDITDIQRDRILDGKLCILSGIRVSGKVVSLLGGFFHNFMLGLYHC